MNEVSKREIARQRSFLMPICLMFVMRWCLDIFDMVCVMVQMHGARVYTLYAAQLRRVLQQRAAAARQREGEDRSSNRACLFLFPSIRNEQIRWWTRTWMGFCARHVFISRAPRLSWYDVNCEASADPHPSSLAVVSQPALHARPSLHVFAYNLSCPGTTTPTCLSCINWPSGCPSR